MKQKFEVEVEYDESLGLLCDTTLEGVIHSQFGWFKSVKVKEK